MVTRTQDEMIPILLNETVKYYNEDPTRRSFNNVSCQYFGPEGKRCAVGRCLIEGANVDEDASVFQFLEDLKTFDDSEFKPEYQGYPIELWDELQTFHDHKHYWDEDGMTEEGWEHVSNVEEIIKNK